MVISSNRRIKPAKKRPKECITHLAVAPRETGRITDDQFTVGDHPVDKGCDILLHSVYLLLGSSCVTSMRPKFSSRRRRRSSSAGCLICPIRCPETEGEVRSVSSKMPAQLLAILLSIICAARSGVAAREVTEHRVEFLDREFAFVPLAPALLIIEPCLDQFQPARIGDECKVEGVLMFCCRTLLSPIPPFISVFIFNRYIG